MTPVKALSSLLIVFFFALRIQAQQVIEPTYVSIAEGLSSPEVLDVMQDSYGLMWIATGNGIQKYDGYRFESFKSVPGRTVSLQDNQTWSLIEDAEHNIWVANGAGVSKYDRHTRGFVNYNFTLLFNTEAGGGQTFKVFLDSENNIWACTQFMQLVQYDRASDKWKYSKFESDTVDNQIHQGFSIALNEDKKGGMWFGSPDQGLMHKPKGADKFTAVPAEKIGNVDFVGFNNLITAMYTDSTNTIWIAARNGVYKYNPDNGSFKTIKVYPDGDDVWTGLNSIHMDNDGNVWIANNFRGILKFNGISDQYEEISIAGKLIMKGHGWNITFSGFTVDRSGIFWFGTLQYGVMKYDPVNKPFSVLTHDPANPNSLSPNGVYGIFASKIKPGIVYVGTRGGGINVYDPTKQTFDKITYKVVDDRFGGSARSIAETSDGALWVGTWGDGLIKFDKNYREIKKYKYNPKDDNTISNNQVRSDQAGKKMAGCGLVQTMD
ncbi:MAG: two-component regulator propeller domain-containing protein [Bacteroidota bacterium]